VNQLDRRENGTVPLVSREGDRSMFSADDFLAKHGFPPKNGPVPSRPVNGYRQRRQYQIAAFCTTAVGVRRYISFV